jgi:hypothetical protein
MKCLRSAVFCGLIGVGASGCAAEVASHAAWEEEDEVATATGALEPIQPVGTTPEPGDLFGRAVALGDFDGDRKWDLAIGVPGKAVNGQEGAGAVIVEYAAYRPFAPQFISQDTPGMSLAAEAGDEFGATLATGDFNDDGYDDLAIAATGEDISSVLDAGVVHVIYGSDVGLTTNGQQLLHKGRDGMFGSPATGDQFGIALAVGRFNQGWARDLAIGTRQAQGSGAVHALPGSGGGLVPADHVTLTAFDFGEQFGAALATGDLNGDLLDDLVIGRPRAAVGDVTLAGRIKISYGSNETLLTGEGGLRELTQNTAGIAGTAEAGDAFGASIAVGRFNDDQYADIAVGAPGEDVGSATNAGSINIIFGSADGPTTNGNYQLHQDSSGVSGSPVTNGYFAAALAAGDFDGRGIDDLAVGVPQRFVGPGMVYMFPGSVSGPSGQTESVYTQDTAGMPGGSETNDLFGAALATGDFDRDGRSELAIGVPQEKVGTAANAGAVHLLLGASEGLDIEHGSFFTE